jgi:ribosomal protein S1
MLKAIRSRFLYLILNQTKKRSLFQLNTYLKTLTLQRLMHSKKVKFTPSTLTESTSDGIVVQVSDGVTAFIRKNELSKDKVECRPERFSAGDRVDAKVIGAEKKTKELKLSIKAYEQDEEKKAIEKYGSADSGAALGGILGDALSKAKAKASDKEEKAAKTEKKETKKKK